MYKLSKLFFDHLFSDYSTIEYLGILFGILLFSLIAGFIMARAFYTAVIVSTPFNPILGVEGKLVRRGEENVYQSLSFDDIKKRIIEVYSKILWKDLMYVFIAYVVSITALLYPSLYRLRISFIPMLYRLNSNPYALFMKGLVTTIVLSIPPILGLCIFLGIITNWIYYTSMTVVNLLISIVLLMYLITIFIYTVYVLFNRVEFALATTLSLIFIYTNYFSPGIRLEIVLFISILAILAISYIIIRMRWFRI